MFAPMSDINPAQHHRHFLLLEGELNDCLAHFFSLSQQLDAPILVASNTQDIALQVEQDYSDKQAKVIATGKLKQVLGQSHQAVFVDIEQGLSANAISLISGTVQGGGLFVLALRKLSDWFQQDDQEQARYLPWPLTFSDAKPHFKQYFLNKLQLSHVKHIKLDSSQMQAPLSKLSAPNKPMVPTLEQANLIKDLQGFAQAATLLQQADPQAISSRVVLAHRGRGKSTALGMALAQITQSNNKIRCAITGPNKASLAQLEKSYQDALFTNASLMDAPVKNTLAPSLFFSPDSLIHNPEPVDLLIVDEAAALPLPVLKSLLNTYKHLVFSSTDHGYEGAGRGFGIKFFDYLKDTSQNFKAFTLKEPIRWLKEDGLEAFIDDLLLLEDPTLPSISTQASPLTCFPIAAEAWLKNQSDLNHCFSLLVSAHYQTSPDDIRWILDDPSVSTWLAKDKDTLVSTAIMTEEGELASDLAQEVAQGTRRPRGHLLPQSLLAHEGHLEAGNYRYQRISRIATHPLCQGQGHASQLLNDIAQASQLDGIDFLCTSFAATPQVLSFWQNNGFICVRLGTTRDQASGCYSVMMLKALTPKAQTLANKYHGLYLSNAALNIRRDFPDLEVTLTKRLLLPSSQYANADQNEKQALDSFEAQKDQQDLALFAFHHRPYETIRAQLYRRFISRQASFTHSEEVSIKLLKEVALKPIKDANFSQFNLTSKKMIDKALRKAVANHLI